MLETEGFRTVQNGMLYDMEHAGIVLRQSAETDAENHLSVIAVGVVQSSTGFLMGKFPVMRIKVGQNVLPLDAESMQAIADVPCWHYAKSSLRFFVFRSF